MIAIYKRELKSYFTSMIGCIFVAVIIAFSGLYFMAYNLTSGYTYFSYTLYSITFILLIAVPILTMKCFAEDRKNKTDQLLMTAPISLTKIVLGKYFAMLTVFAIPNLVFCTCPLIISTYGTAQFKVDYASILAYFLLGSIFIAIGMYISSLTESQVIAAILTFVALFVIYMWDGLMDFLPFTTLANVLADASIISVFTDFALNRICDVTGLIAYVSTICVFVFLTIQALQKRRWS